MDGGIWEKSLTFKREHSLCDDINEPVMTFITAGSALHSRHRLSGSHCTKPGSPRLPMAQRQRKKEGNKSIWQGDV